MNKPDPSKEELLTAAAGSIDTESLRFEGVRGDSAFHLSRTQLESAIAKLPAPPRDRGRVEFLVARPSVGQRDTPQQVELTIEGGMPGDRWADDDRYGPEYQLATTRSDTAKLIANSQALEIHGDNLYLHLDLSTSNLPTGSVLKMGTALLRVTAQAHNGCKKWVQRFGLDVMQLSMEPEMRAMHLRGIYLQVVKTGIVRVGDEVIVVSRGQVPTKPI